MLEGVQHLNQSKHRLTKKLAYVRHLSKGVRVGTFVICILKKNSPRFSFSGESACDGRTTDKVSNTILLTLLLKCYFIFMFLLHAERRYMRLRIHRVLFSGELTPISLESHGCFTQL